jgi:phosphomevalonate kinase
VHDFAADNPAQYTEDLAQLTRLARNAQAALADRTVFLRLVDDYFTALADLDAHAGAGIVTERHRQLRAVAAREGGVFKTSGAGGGDVGLAFSASGEPAERLGRALSDAGASVVALEFGVAGVMQNGAIQNGVES